MQQLRLSSALKSVWYISMMALLISIVVNEREIVKFKKDEDARQRKLASTDDDALNTPRIWAFRAKEMISSVRDDLQRTYGTSGLRGVKEKCAAGVMVREDMYFTCIAFPYELTHHRERSQREVAWIRGFAHKSDAETFSRAYRIYVNEKEDDSDTKSTNELAEGAGGAVDHAILFYEAVLKKVVVERYPE